MLPLTWTQVRLHYPSQWVIVEIRVSHLEGIYFFPDRMVVRAAHLDYARMQAYYQTLLPSTTHLLVHTSLTSLILYHLPLPPP